MNPIVLPLEDVEPIVLPIEQPSLGESAWAGVQQGALAFGGAVVGGIPRILGDLTNTPSMAAWGRAVQLNAQQAARELTPLGESGGQSIMREAIGSATASAPALGWGRVAPAIATMGTQTYADSYGEAREGGLGVGRAHVYAGIDTIFETVPEMYSLPVLFKPGMKLARRSMEFISKELAGEEVTAVGQAMNNMLQLQPEMTVGEYWDNLKKVMIDTALVVPPTAALQMGMGRAFSFARRTTDGVNIRVDGEPRTPPQATPPAVPAAATPGAVPPGAPPAPPGQPPLDMAPVDTATWEGEGGPPVPEGPEVVISSETATLLSATVVPEAGPEIAADVAPMMNLPQSTPDAELPEVPGVTPYWTTTPDAIASSDVPDPRLYNGVFSAGGSSESAPGYVFVDQLSNGEWIVGRGLVRSPNSVAAAYEAPVAKVHLENLFDKSVTFDDPRQVLSYLQSAFNVKSHKDIEFVSKRHMLLSMRDALNETRPLTEQQLQLYGEGLARISDKARAFRAKIGRPLHELVSDVPQVSKEEQNPAALFSSGDTRWTPIEATRDQPLLTMKGEVAGSTHQLWEPQHAGSVYIQATETQAQFKRAQKYASMVEKWAKMYGMSGSRFVINTVAGKEAAGAAGRIISDPATGKEVLVHFIRMGVREDDSTIALAHEFGHAILYDLLHRADAKTVSTLVERWLDQVNSSENLSWPPLKREVAELGGLGRLSVLVSSKAWNGPDFTAPDPMWPDGPAQTYSLRFEEFFADQVAQHIHDNDYYMKEDANMRSFMNRVAGMLEAFYNQVGRKFVPNSTFKSWLDSLTGKSEGKVKAKLDTPLAVEAPKKGKPIKRKDISLDTIPPDKKVKERNHLIRIFKQEGLWDDDAKATYDPTGKPEDFEFAEAKKFLDAVGVTWEDGDDYAGLRAVDEPDTLPMRQSLLHLGKAMNMPAEMRKKLAHSALGIRNFGKGWRNMLTAVQIRKMFGEQIPAVKEFVNGLEKMFAYRDKWKRRANDTLELMQSAGQEQRTRVFELLMEEDASEKFFGEFYSEEDLSPGSETKRKNIAILPPEVMARYKINEAGAELYAKMRADWADALDISEIQAIDEIWRNYGISDKNLADIDPAKIELVDEAVKKMQKAFAQMKAKPYYPHTRFGDYYVTAKDLPSGVATFAQFDSLKKAKQFAESMSDSQTVVRVGEMQDNIRTLMNLPWEVMNMLKGELNLTADQIKEFEDIMKNYTSGESFIKKFKSRKNIEGWENNAELGPRVYADYFVKFSNYISRKKFSPILDSAKTSALKQRKEQFSEAGEVGNSLLIDRMLNWMGETKDYVMSPDIEFANLKAGVTIFYLGLVPKSALVNAFSVPMLSLPYLGQRFGDVKAMKFLGQAYTDVFRSLKRKEAFSEEEWKAIDYLENLGVINESYATELAAVREGGYLVESTELGGAKSAFYKLRYASMWGFHKMEVMNRMVTAVAAYRMSRQGLTADRGFDLKAAEFAKQAIQDTQNENAQWNRAAFTRGKKSIMFQFLTYSQNAMFQMYGGDPAWQRMLALQLMMAGLLGLPFAKNIDDVIKWFSKRVFGTDTSAEMAIRQLLDDTIINPEWILKGASYDILGTGANLYGSLSMGSLVPGTDALAMEGKFADRLANAASDVGGAGASVILDAMKAIASDDPNSVRRWMTAMPQFAKNSYEGYRMLTEGTVLDGAGDPILEATGAQGAAKLLGFQASDVSREKEKRFMQKQQAQFWLTRRRIVLQLYEQAKKTGDSDTYETAEKLRDEYNEEAPDAALQLTRKDIRRALDRRMDLNKKKESGEAPTRREAGVYQRVEDLYSVE